jgi:peptide/nickel transport system substrate-binding protein/oligopeptide transport system substrate-binding protein
VELIREGDPGPPLVVLALVTLCVVAPAWAAAQARAAVEDAGAGTLYRRPLGNDPVTLDPARIRDIYSLAVAQQLFDGLVEFDHTLTISPALAQYWKSSRDGLTWTFTLRKGVKFHHGREVTAEDVVYSFTRILDPKTRSGAADLFVNIKGAQEFRDGHASRVAGLAALDRHTVQVTLSEAFAPFVSVLAVGHAKIVPSELVEQQGDAFGTRPVGTGPFSFMRWDRGKEIVLAANPEYFNGAPKITRLVYRIFPGENFEATYSEFQRGQLEDSPLPYRRIQFQPNQIHVKRPMFSVRFYGVNRRIKPFDDKRVRQALIYAIDRTAVIDEVFLGRYLPARGILPPGTQGYNPKLRGYAYDPQRARGLLAEAGYPGGRGLPPVAIWSSVKDRVMVEHTHLKRYLEAVGFRPEFHYETDWPTFSRLLGDGKLPVFLYAWFADVPDPDNFLAKLFHSRSPRNFFGYANPAVDDLLAHARADTDLLRRVDLYRRAEQLIMDDAPIIPFWHYTYERVFQSYVRSVEVNGLGDPYIPLRKIWLDRR